MNSLHRVSQISSSPHPVKIVKMIAYPLIKIKKLLLNYNSCIALFS